MFRNKTGTSCNGPLLIFHWKFFCPIDFNSFKKLAMVINEEMLRVFSYCGLSSIPSFLLAI